MLHVNSELVISEPAGPDYDALPSVKQHVTALTSYTSRLAEAGVLSTEAASFAHLFAQRHDAGYRTDISLMQAPDAIAILGSALEAVESPVDPYDIAEYLQRHEKDYMAARIIGHGVLGLVANTYYLQEKHRLSRRKALGLASILSAHHPGFPITMVSSKYLEGDTVIPDEQRSAFFIDAGGENPETIRRRLAEFGASELEISPADALRAAVLGYSLDRLSAGSIPDKLQFKAGRVELFGGEVLQKKAGLVAGDLRRKDRKKGDDSLVHDLFNIILDRIIEENEAATVAATAADAPDIQQFVVEQRVVIQARLHTAQAGARSVMHRLNLMGKFSQLNTERKTLSAWAGLLGEPETLYTLAAYDAIIDELAKEPAK